MPGVLGSLLRQTSTQALSFTQGEAVVILQLGSEMSLGGPCTGIINPRAAAFTVTEVPDLIDKGITVRIQSPWSLCVVVVVVFRRVWVL